jgi:hypothetical protein
MDGDLLLPEGGIKLRNFNPQVPYVVSINGNVVNQDNPYWISFHEFPAKIHITYK